jgi:hypothetical protein
MSTLTEKAQALKKTLPPERSGKAPEMKGQLLGILPHKEGEIRIVWDSYEDHHFLSVRLWTVDDNKQYWPSKVGFTVRLRDLPALGEAVGKALDLAISETRTGENTRPAYRSAEGVGSPF